MATEQKHVHFSYHSTKLSEQNTEEAERRHENAQLFYISIFLSQVSRGKVHRKSLSNKDKNHTGLLSRNHGSKKRVKGNIGSVARNKPASLEFCIQ